MEELKRDVNGCLFAEFMDEEGDIFKVEFHFDNSAFIAHSYTHLHLSSVTLRKIAELTEEAERLYLKEMEENDSKVA